jgi:hypothetical protein
MTDIEFNLSDSTFAKIQALKKSMGFENKEWDAWFSHLITLYQKPKNGDLEEIMKKLYYDKFYDEWVKNFALNLGNIWKETSAKELSPVDSEYHTQKHSAIVIGRGPSIKKYGHLQLLANSDYKGAIICCDGALINSLKAGVTPYKFPDFYVVTIDTADIIAKYYDDPIVDKYGHKIRGIFSTVVNPQTVQRARDAGIKIHWLHALFDYNEGKKSFNQTSATMVRAQGHSSGLPAIQTGGNVGTASWFVAWQILKRSTVALIGINHGWNEDDPIESIISHYPLSKELDPNSESFKKLFPKLYNPEFKCHYILDPIFLYYSKAFKEFITRSPSWLTTINATQGGSIFGEKIQCSTFEEFLEKFKH